MRSRSRWPAGGAFLLGGAVIVVGCAKGGPGEAASAFGTDNVGFGSIDDGGGTIEASADDSSVGTSGTGLNTPAASDMSGDDASGGSGNAPAVCDPTTCASGCCANRTCAGGTDDTACGQTGGNCTDCTATNQVCSFGSCIAGNETSPAPTDTGTGSSPPSGMTPPRNPVPSTSCGGSMCTNACFPLGLPCCTSAGACGCIALYFLPCQ